MPDLGTTKKVVLEAPRPDGRRLRSERSRQAIITAVLDLQESGNLVPTAQQIAERAGVGIRSFFRHFADMDSLFEAVDTQMRRTYEPMFAEEASEGDFSERLAGIITRRAQAYERLKNINLSAAAQRWQSEALQESYSRNQYLLRKNLNRCMPELECLDDSRREAVDALTSFEMWHRLRDLQGLSVDASVNLVESMVYSVIEA